MVLRMDTLARRPTTPRHQAIQALDRAMRHWGLGAPLAFAIIEIMNSLTAGWAGSIMFALSAVPQAWRSYRQGHSHGIGWPLIVMTLIGEVLSLSYALPRHLWPLTMNYLVNIAAMSIIGWFKARPTHGRKSAA